MELGSILATLCPWRKAVENPSLYGVGFLPKEPDFSIDSTGS
jgi:hypothetical protein